MNNTLYLTSKFYPHFCSETIYNNQDLPIRLVTNREPKINKVIPNILVLSPNTPPRSAQSR
jgi:hypothetical protein